DPALLPAFRRADARFGREPFRDFGTVGDGAEDIFGRGVELDGELDVAGVLCVHGGGLISDRGLEVLGRRKKRCDARVRAERTRRGTWRLTARPRAEAPR